MGLGVGARRVQSYLLRRYLECLGKMYGCGSNGRPGLTEHEQIGLGMTRSIFPDTTCLGLAYLHWCGVGPR